MFYPEKIISTVFLPSWSAGQLESWRVNYSWNGLMEQIFFSRVVAGDDEPHLQCYYLQSSPVRNWQLLIGREWKINSPPVLLEEI